MIRRAPRPETGWTTFDNRVLQDDRLSFKALGILVYILSKPDDWSIRAEQLADSHEDGRRAVLTGLTELQEAGYLVRRRVQNESGHWGWEQTVYDHPVSGNPGNKSTEVRFPEVGETDVGEAHFSTRTENEGLRSTTRGAARRRAERASRPKSRRVVRPDDDTGSDDEAPALGGSPRPSRAERNETSAKRGTSGYGLAIRLERGLAAAGVSGSAAVVDKGILAKRLSELHRKGSSWELLAGCVETFVAAPDRYRSGDLKGWTQFLAAMPKLEADTEKRLRATRPASETYGDDPYANEVD